MAAGPSFELPRPFGPYELVRRLARAGDSQVFLARARSVAGFEKAVAIKTINPALGEDPEFARLLVEEANIAAQLSHKNVVQVIDLGRIDGLHYIAMEYVDGVDLGRLSARLAMIHAWPLSPRVAAYIVREVCEGLDHAHRKSTPEGRPLGIVHRDVSPSNVLLSFSGEVKLTDFGVSKATLRAATLAGTVKGRYAYMAPEQVRGSTVDARTDVFAAGIVLYEMVTGQPAYPDGTTAELVERVGSGRFPPAASLRPDLPRSILDILQRATEPDPARRYPTARALAEDLASYLYTVPPNPEMDVARLLETSTDTSRNVMQPLGALLVDDSSDEVTQIESAAAIRARFLASRAHAPTDPPPAAMPPASSTAPTPRPPPPAPLTLSSALPVRPSGGIARVRGRAGRAVSGFTIPAPTPAAAAVPAPAPAPVPAAATVPVPIPAPVRASQRRSTPAASPVLRGATLAGLSPTTPRREIAETLPEMPVVGASPAAVVPVAVRANVTAAVPLTVVRAPTLPPTGLSARFPVPIPPGPTPDDIEALEPMEPMEALDASEAPVFVPPVPVPMDGAVEARVERVQRWKLVAAGVLALCSVAVLLVVVLTSR